MINEQLELTKDQTLMLIKTLRSYIQMNVGLKHPDRENYTTLFTKVQNHISRYNCHEDL